MLRTCAESGWLCIFWPKQVKEFWVSQFWYYAFHISSIKPDPCINFSPSHCTLWIVTSSVTLYMYYVKILFYWSHRSYLTSEDDNKLYLSQMDDVIKWSGTKICNSKGGVHTGHDNVDHNSVTRHWHVKAIITQHQWYFPSFWRSVLGSFQWQKFQSKFVQNRKYKINSIFYYNTFSYIYFGLFFLKMRHHLSHFGLLKYVNIDFLSFFLITLNLSCITS